VLQNDSIHVCHKNASNFNSRTFLTKNIYFPCRKKMVDPPILTQKLWRTLHWWYGWVDSHPWLKKIWKKVCKPTYNLSLFGAKTKDNFL
jgi:hypothetical protein